MMCSDMAKSRMNEQAIVLTIDQWSHNQATVLEACRESIFRRFIAAREHTDVDLAAQDRERGGTTKGFYTGPLDKRHQTPEFDCNLQPQVKQQLRRKR